MGNKEVTEFIEKKMSEKINEDKSYRNISNNLYAGNYIGFKDSSQMEKFDKLDLYTTYFTLFPNTAAVAFAYIILFICLILIVATIYGLFKKDQEENFLAVRMVISLFTLIIFIGYFSYTVYENGNIYGDMQISELTNIKADPFLENYFSLIKERHPSQNLLITVICLFSASFGLTFLTCFISRCPDNEESKSSESVEKKNENLV